MRVVLMVLCVVGLLVGPGSGAARADEKELVQLREDVAMLVQAVEMLKQQVAAMEARVRALKGLPAGAAPMPGPEAGADPKPESDDSPAAHSAPAPAATTGEPRIDEKYDRFEARAEIAVEARAIAARHKDDRSDTIDVAVSWIAMQDEGKLPRYELQFVTTNPVRKWPEGTMLYMLLDGERTVQHADPSTAYTNGKEYEVVTVVPSIAMVRDIEKVEKMELRIGDYEIEVPRAYRGAIRKANERLKARFPK